MVCLVSSIIVPHITLFVWYYGVFCGNMSYYVPALICWGTFLYCISAWKVLYFIWVLLSVIVWKLSRLFNCRQFLIIPVSSHSREAHAKILISDTVVGYMCCCCTITLVKHQPHSFIYIHNSAWKRLFSLYVNYWKLWGER